jgi:hypothetical protein
MANDVTATPFSLPLAGYGFTVTAISNFDGTTANACVFPVPENFSPSGLLIQCISHTTGTPAAAYASYNKDSLTVTASTGTVDRHVDVNIYVKTTTGTAATLLVILF